MVQKAVARTLHFIASKKTSSFITISSYKSFDEERSLE